MVDFGLALAVHTSEDGSSSGPSDGDETPANRRLVGTPAYMSPEQWRGEECTAATDIWAIGLMLYELCTGRLPIAARSAHDLREAVISPEPIPVGEALGDAPDALIQLIENCLAKRPESSSNGWAGGGRTARTSVRRPTNDGGGREPFSRLVALYGAPCSLVFRARRGNRPLCRASSSCTHGRGCGCIGCGEEFVCSGRCDSPIARGVSMGCAAPPSRTPPPSSAGLQDCIGFDGGYRDECAGIEPRGFPESAPDPAVVGSEVDALVAKMRNHPGQLALSLHELATKRGSMVLLLVDQMEELFTQTEDAQEGEAFLNALCAAGDDATGPVRVMLTLRDDFLGHLAHATPVAGTILQDVVVLKRPSPDSLAEVLLKPLEMVGFSYEEPSMVDSMLESVERGGGLPLLQFTARTLWDNRDVKSRLLTRAEYERIGGVEGALAQHAESVLKRFTAHEMTTARVLFLRMVTPERTRRTRSRNALTEGMGEVGDGVLNHLTQARLISARRNEDGEDEEAVFEFAHESLLNEWPTLSRWLDENREEIVFLTEVGRAASLWDKRGRRTAELWTGEALANAVGARSRATTPIPRVVQEFIENGQKRDAQLRLRRRFWSISVPLILAVTALVFAFQKYEADFQRDAAQNQQEQAFLQQEQAIKAQALAEQQRVEALLENAEEQWNGIGCWKRARSFGWRWRSPQPTFRPCGDCGAIGARSSGVVV